MALTDIIYGAASTAQSLLRSTSAADVVAITYNGTPLFAAARPLFASVYEFADVMEHPLEDGSVIADHIVRKPIEIELPMMCVGDAAYRSTYAQIRAVYNAGLLLTVVTRTASYSNMVLSDIPHDEAPDSYNAIALRIRLREARLVSPQPGLSTQQAANPSQSSTQARGSQQTTTASASTAGRAGGSYQQSGAGPTPSPAGSTLYQWYSGTRQ